MEHLGAWVKMYGVRADLMLGSSLIVLIAAVATFYVRRGIFRLLLGLHVRFSLAYETILLITRIANIVLWIGFGFLLLSYWGVSVTGLWTVLVSIAAVIGVGFLAVWTMVSNITANLFITIWRPFRMGATVEMLPENLRGRVVDRNFMFTILRENENHTLYIPNNLFFQKIFRVSEDRQQHLFERFENHPPNVK